MFDPNDLEHRFNHHPAATREKQEKHAGIRNVILAVAHFINEEVPDGREKSTAITKLEEAMFWANASVARNK